MGILRGKERAAEAGSPRKQQGARPRAWAAGARRPPCTHRLQALHVGPPGAQLPLVNVRVFFPRLLHVAQHAAHLGAGRGALRHLCAQLCRGGLAGGVRRVRALHAHAVGVKLGAQALELRLQRAHHGVEGVLIERHFAAAAVKGRGRIQEAGLGRRCQGKRKNSARSGEGAAVQRKKGGS